MVCKSIEAYHFLERTQSLESKKNTKFLKGSLPRHEQNALAIVAPSAHISPASRPLSSSCPSFLLTTKAEMMNASTSGTALAFYRRAMLLCLGLTITTLRGTMWIYLIRLSVDIIIFWTIVSRTPLVIATGFWLIAHLHMLIDWFAIELLLCFVTLKCLFSSFWVTMWWWCFVNVTNAPWFRTYLRTKLYFRIGIACTSCNPSSSSFKASLQSHSTPCGVSHSTCGIWLCSENVEVYDEFVRVACWIWWYCIER